MMDIDNINVALGTISIEVGEYDEVTWATVSRAARPLPLLKLL